jgi:hypothetical protein
MAGVDLAPCPSSFLTTLRGTRATPQSLFPAGTIVVHRYSCTHSICMQHQVIQRASSLAIDTTCAVGVSACIMTAKRLSVRHSASLAPPGAPLVSLDRSEHSAAPRASTSAPDTPTYTAQYTTSGTSSSPPPQKHRHYPHRLRDISSHITLTLPLPHHIAPSR